MSLLSLKGKRRAIAPVLLQTLADAEDQPAESGAGTVGRSRTHVFESCANPQCHSSWLHVWRSSSTPVFEGGWTCSFDCTLQRMRVAVRRERDGSTGVAGMHRHRIPLGLLMLEQGWITQSQLRQGLEAQKSAGRGRLGEWLVRQGAIDEQTVSRALALQWSCPVLPVESEGAGVRAILPRLFVDAFGALPLRFGAGKVLYLGFEESIDKTLALALERMTELRVESGIVQGSAFARAHARLLAERFPHADLFDASSESAAVYMLAKSLERGRAVESRLVRVHDCLWLRMWIRPPQEAVTELNSVQDVVCSISEA